MGRRRVSARPSSLLVSGDDRPVQEPGGPQTEPREQPRRGGRAGEIEDARRPERDVYPGRDRRRGGREGRQRADPGRGPGAGRAAPQLAGTDRAEGDAPHRRLLHPAPQRRARLRRRQRDRPGHRHRPSQAGRGGRRRFLSDGPRPAAHSSAGTDSRVERPGLRRCKSPFIREALRLSAAGVLVDSTANCTRHGTGAQGEDERQGHQDRGPDDRSGQGGPPSLPAVPTGLARAPIKGIKSPSRGVWRGGRPTTRRGRRGPRPRRPRPRATCFRPGRGGCRRAEEPRADRSAIGQRCVLLIPAAWGPSVGRHLVRRIPPEDLRIDRTGSWVPSGEDAPLSARCGASRRVAKVEARMVRLRGLDAPYTPLDRSCLTGPCKPSVHQFSGPRISRPTCPPWPGGSRLPR